MTETTKTNLDKMFTVIDNNMYPGYPFCIYGCLDMNDNKAEIDREEMDIDTFIEKFNAKCCYQLIGNYKSQKGDWLHDTKMDMPQNYLQSNYDDFYIDNLNIAKLYFALMSAIRQEKNSNNAYSVIFFCSDDDCDYVDVQVFHSEEDLIKFRQEYFAEDFD